MAKKATNVSEEIVSSGDDPILYRCKCGWWSTSKKYDLEFHRSSHLCAHAGNYRWINGRQTFFDNNLVDSFTL